MEKKIIQDIFVDPKSIRRIKKEDLKEQAQQKSQISERQEIPKNFVPQKRKSFENFSDELEPVSKRSHIFLWIISIIAIATVLFFLSLFFATATVTITPKEEPVTLDDTYTINASTTASGLNYQIIPVEKEISQSLETDGETTVEDKATGEATIYNDYSASNQQLIINTRLETSDGLVYRIVTPVDVPGIRTINGVKTPGSVKVGIVADAPGASYNLTVADSGGNLSIPGFEGTPEYNGFYAQLSQNVTGGYIGSAKTVASTTLATGRTALQNTLTNELVAEANTQLPAGDTLLNGGYFVNMTDLPDIQNETGYTISEQATLYAVVFNTEELSQFIAQNEITEFDNSPVNILWGSTTASISGLTTTPWLENSLTLTLQGTADIVWSYDTNSILNEIKGQPKTVLNDVMANNKEAITAIEATIRPEWKSSFPGDTNRIKIINSVTGTSTQN